MLQIRKALETIKNTSGWNWSGRKDKPDRTIDERWALIRSAMEDQASGTMHVDPALPACRRVVEIRAARSWYAGQAVNPGAPARMSGLATAQKL
jgi:hypothetical protein